MIIPSGHGQANLIFQGAPVPTGAQVTFGFAIGPSVGDPAEAGGNIVAAIIASTLMTNFDSSLLMTTVRVKFGPNDTGPQADVSANISGAISGKVNAPQAAVLIQKATLFGGRTGRGRMYFPGWTQDSTLEGGNITPANLLLVQADFTQLLVELSTRDVSMALLHAPGSPVTPPRVVTSLLVSPTLATQRRRMRR